MVNKMHAEHQESIKIVSLAEYRVRQEFGYAIMRLVHDSRMNEAHDFLHMASDVMDACGTLQKYLKSPLQPATETREAIKDADTQEAPQDAGRVHTYGPIQGL